MINILFTLLRWYLFIEIISTMTTGLPFTIRYIISKRISKWCVENLPDTWRYKVSLFTLSSSKAFISSIKIKKTGLYKIDGHLHETSADYIQHRWGRNISTTIVDSIKIWDKEFDEVQFNRDKQLKKILENE